MTGADAAYIWRAAREIHRDHCTECKLRPGDPCGEWWAYERKAQEAEHGYIYDSRTGR